MTTTFNTLITGDLFRFSDEETVYKTLVENPAKLFGFSNSGQEA